MADTISAAMVYQMIQDLRMDVRNQHERLRTDMQVGFMTITTEVGKHATRLDLLDAKLTTLGEYGCKAMADCLPPKLGKKHAAWAGGVGAGIAVIYEAFRHLTSK